MKSKLITTSLIIGFIIFLFPINATSGVIYLKSGKAIANAQDLVIQDQDIHYTVGGKAQRIKVEEVKNIDLISNKPKKATDESYDDDPVPYASPLSKPFPISVYSKRAEDEDGIEGIRYRDVYSDEELDRMTLKNMSCLLEKYTLTELKRMSDEELKIEMLQCPEAGDDGPFLYPNGSSGNDWSKRSDEPTQKLWGFEVPVDPAKRRQYFEDMEEENRQLEKEIFGRPLD